MKSAPVFIELGNVPGYRQGEVLSESEQSRVVAATRLSDGRAVVLKILNCADSSEHDGRARARHELEMTRRAAGPGVVAMLGLEQTGAEPALVMDRVAGQTLRARIDGRPLPIADFFAIALPLCRAVAQVHAARIIHRDIKPDNVLVDQHGQPTLLDFGIATVLPRGQDELREPGILQGSLQYLAPEQSGRMNRGVDMRTDLYALGITLYEMLAGQPPWDGEDPLQLVHAHLTRTPPALAARRGGELMPPPLEEIIARLLAKEPDERYQSARGLLLDLQRCAQGSAGGAPLPFELSSALPDHLRFSGKLHGRAGVARALEEAFAETRAGLPMLALLTGTAGLGKTAHAEALRPLVEEAGGRWAQGRFQKEQQHQPYSALREALGGVCARLLAEHDEDLGVWRSRLHEALGPIAAVVVEVVPELERLLGKPAPSPPLGPAETRNRFILGMRRFLGVLATPTTPLVLCLDDLHNADPGSLHLIEALLMGPSPQWLMVLATAEEDQNGPGAPLHPLVKEAAERDRLREIPVPPLSSREMTDWLSDVLRLAPAEVEDLASVLGRKAGDNPLFTQQLLRRLEETAVLHLDDRGRWSWSNAAVAAAQIPDDLAGVMREKLGRVSSPARRVAGWASAIGGPFDLAAVQALEVLARDRAGQQQRILDVADALLELSEAGLLARDQSSYRFAHPSLRTAAGESLPADEARDIHAELGWEMLSRPATESPEGPALFAVAEHFHAAYDLETGGRASRADDAGAAPGPRLQSLPLERRRRVVTAFRLAGERALGSTAYEAAIRHLQAAAQAADPRLARDRPAEAFAVDLGLAKALFLAGRREQSDAAFATLAERRLPPRLAAEARSAQVALLTSAGELGRAIAAGLAGLAALGLRFSPKPSSFGLLPRLAGVLLRLRRRSDQRLLEGARTTDENVEAAAMLIDAVGPAAYWSNAKLYAALHLTNISGQLRRGYASSISYALAKQALLTGGLMKDVPAAMRLSRLAMEIQGRHPCPQHAPRIRTLMLMTVEAWCRPLAAVVGDLPAATRACEEAGDLEYANYSASLRMGLGLASGMNLRALREQMEETARRCGQWGYQEVSSLEERSLGLVEQLLGERLCDEEDPLGRKGLLSRETRAPVYMHTTRGLLVLYLLGRNDDCLRFAGETADIDQVLPGQSLVLEHNFWHGMAAAAGAGADHARARPLRRTLGRLIRTLRRHAGECPNNNLHRLHLLCGEEQRLRGRHLEALAHYAQAAEHAGRFQVVHLVALACERRALLLAQMGLTTESELFLRQAHEHYRSWGARRKCELLEAAHPSLQRWAAERIATPPASHGSRPAPSSAQGTITRARKVRSQGRGRGGRSETTTNDRVDNRTLDVNALLAVTQAITEELTVEGVLRRLLSAALTSAGAQRGVLVLRHEGVAQVEAESSVGEGFALRSVPLEDFDHIPRSVVRLVERTGERLVLSNASAHESHGRDPYVQRAKVRSLLAAPIVRQGMVVGLIYVENNAVSDAFTPDRVELLQLLATQAAISLDNAQLYTGLEAKVQSRTRQLDARNRQLRLVLDNVEQGFLTVDRAGVISGERSAVVERWLGAIDPGATLTAYIQRSDHAAGQLLALSWEALIEDVMPFEILIGQLPQRLTVGNGSSRRVLQLAFRPIHDEGAAGNPGAFSQMLVVISDVTATVARQISERSQRELLEIFQRIVRDRPGMEEFRAEASFLVAQITGMFSGDLSDLKRSLHTLKGNAGLFGLASLADLCGAAEEDIEDIGDVPPAARRDEIRARWQEIDLTLSTFLSSGPRDTVELSPGEVDELSSAIAAGAPPAVLTALVQGWSRESMVDRLGRIADQVRRLGRLSGKGELSVFTEPNGLRLDAEAWASFWSALVHVVRNAVDHGIEGPEERVASGKLHPPTIVLRTFMAEGNLVIEVSDDGRGVAWEKIAAKAREAGLPAETQDHLVAALFSEGLSTQEQATEMSGRGVGAGAVRVECEARGGHVVVRSERGRGTTFSFIFPLAEAQRRGSLIELPSLTPRPTLRT